MTSRSPDRLIPCSLSKASVAKRTPRPVAASLPRDPPSSLFEHGKLDMGIGLGYVINKFFLTRSLFLVEILV